MTQESPREIGGYLEMETYHGREYHPGLYALNLGRTAITWFFRKVGARKVWIPCFLCGSVIEALENEGFELRRYFIRPDLYPASESLPRTPLSETEWLLVLNNYGQLEDSYIKACANLYGNVLFDYTHAFFQKPVPGTNVVYSVRKFLGVTDGAYLQTEKPIRMPEETDASHTRCAHILGRYEESASAHYQEMLDNAHGYEGAQAKKMSPLTQNLLRSFDYEWIKTRRMENYQMLDSLLGGKNPLEIEGFLRTPAAGPFCYPFYADKGTEIRRRLAARKIYIPTYWSNVLRDMPEDTLEHRYAANILALPCDQRYGTSDMKEVAEAVMEELEK
ncbi:MAG: hypothetical protein VZR02_01125 [Lachnospiraceae bacterium]|nr:hypothetical protein [Lachnospiraceae bacterium]